MRNIRLAMLLVLILACGASIAQPTGFKPAESSTDLKKRFSEEGKKIVSIRSNFTQEKNLSMLEEKIVSEGKFWYKKDNKVRLEYQKPFRYLMMLNGNQMIIRDEQKESRVSTQSSKLFQQVNRIIMGCVNGSILNTRDFTSQVFQNEKFYLLVMTPASKTLKEFFETIQVMVDKKDWTVIGVTLQEPGGDNTIIKFTNRVYNENLDDSLFTP